MHIHTHTNRDHTKSRGTTGMKFASGGSVGGRSYIEIYIASWQTVQEQSRMQREWQMRGIHMLAATEMSNGKTQSKSNGPIYLPQLLEVGFSDTRKHPVDLKPLRSCLCTRKKTMRGGG